MRGGLGGFSHVTVQRLKSLHSQVFAGEVVDTEAVYKAAQLFRYGGSLWWCPVKWGACNGTPALPLAYGAAQRGASCGGNRHEGDGNRHKGWEVDGTSSRPGSGACCGGVRG